MKKTNPKVKTTKKSTTKKKTTNKVKQNNTSKVIAVPGEKKDNSSSKISIIIVIVIILCFVPSVLIPWMELWKVSKDVLEVFYFIRSKAIPIALLCMCIGPIYEKIRKDRQDEYAYKQMKFSDKFYRYISPDTIQAIIGFSFIGIATLIVKGITETSFIVEKVGDEMIAEALILTPLAIIFYTTWILYCNRLKTKFDKFKYLIAIILIIWVFILIATG